MGLQRLQPRLSTLARGWRRQTTSKLFTKLSNSQLEILSFKVSSAFENYAVWLDIFK